VAWLIRDTQEYANAMSRAPPVETVRCGRPVC